MNALGFHVNPHRVAAHGLAGFIAALGGMLLVWFNGRISPGTIDIGPVINILVIAVLGGIRHPIGPFIGALLFVLLHNFAIDLIDPRALQHSDRHAFLSSCCSRPTACSASGRRRATGRDRAVPPPAGGRSEREPGGRTSARQPREEEDP